VFHQFVVFSTIDDSDTVLPKYVQCNNCSVVHKIYDLCKSEIVAGRDELNSVNTIDDIIYTIPEDIRGVLESYDVDLPTWEHAQFVLQNKVWGTAVILTKDVLEDETQGKLLMIKGPREFNIETFIVENYINGEPK
jgi:hypothetical protein